MAPSAVKDTILLDLLNLECLSMEIMCFFFLQMCCLFRLPSLPCMFCHRYPHPAFLSVSTSKAFIIISPRGRDPRQAWILDSARRGFRIPGTGTWNLDSGFSSIVGWRISWAVFRIPKPRIPQANFPRFWITQAKISWIPESKFPYMRRIIDIFSLKPFHSD